MGRVSTICWTVALLVIVLFALPSMTDIIPQTRYEPPRRGCVFGLLGNGPPDDRLRVEVCVDQNSVFVSATALDGSALSPAQEREAQHIALQPDNFFLDSQRGDDRFCTTVVLPDDQ